jgi:hypothetical protein
MPKASRASSRKKMTDRQSEQAPQQPTSSAATQPVKPLYRSREMSPRGRLISLVVGDTLCFLIFASLGTNQHGEGVNVLYSIWVAVPFLAAWFLVSPFVGAFRADIATRPTRMIIRTALSWLATWPVAMLFRWLLIDRVKPSPPSFSDFMSFAFVVLAFNLGLLLLWRWPFALSNDLRKRGL